MKLSTIGAYGAPIENIAVLRTAIRTKLQPLWFHADRLKKALTTLADITSVKLALSGPNMGQEFAAL